MRTTATCLEHLLSTFEGSHSKVGYLYITLAIEEQVLWLKVSVADVELVTI
jgi:hypothetical protein